ncbi:MAG: N-acetylmuramoyl-L-alanine amidase, partial [Defluviitaleaceae bacterium]|nr:N-acetylmuramoyl-L-alanine amidase [Defluviitaleaceae bacterium]
DGRYVQGTSEDMIVWKAQSFAALDVYLDATGRELTVRFGMHQTAPGHSMNFATGIGIFQAVRIARDKATPCYVLTLRDGAKLEGFYVSREGGELRLHLKKRKTLSAGEKPLAGFSFVIDAGHGGNDSGALGMMGGAMPEKAINLSNARRLSLRLAQLGANVTTIRTTDVFYTLHERTETSRKARPDMFISIHANSMAETTDASSIRGITVWYRNVSSKPLADLLMRDLFTINPGTTRRQVSNQSNFYVCRPSWAPSVIIEASFMCNIDDFAWLINEGEQDRLAEATAQAILNYYR